jgi:recombination protein RecR
MEFSSRLLATAVDEMSQLPGIGKRTALRLVLHLLDQPREQTAALAESLTELKKHIKRCRNCHNISDQELCEICSNKSRDEKLVCVVEDIRDVLAIEATQLYNGHYHVLGGKISPIDGIGPSQLNIDSLVNKVKNDQVDELIFALSSTVEGDTTNFYIYNQLKDSHVKLSTIARGIPVGDDLEFADQITLGRSISQRIPFENSLKKD